MTVITDHINHAPASQQPYLEQMYQLIKNKLPDAEEQIKYGMPTFNNGENIVHFAGNKNHIGFYPASKTMAHFAPKLTDYHFSKGALQLPYNEPLPVDLIEQMLDYRISLLK